MDLEEEELRVEGERTQHADLIDEVCETFRRDGRLADLGEELGVVDILAADERPEARADTNEFGVCYADTET